MYNGYSFEINEENEFSNLGIHEIGEFGIVSRGVLIDLPVFFGVDFVRSGTAITIDDIKNWEKKNNIKISKGDILLLRTGRWEQLKQEGYWDFTKLATGFHYTVAEFLKNRDVAAIGCDGVSDVYPSGIESKKDALHELVLVDLGMPIFDNMDLDLLSEELEKLNRSTFFFVANPLKIQGATGKSSSCLLTTYLYVLFLVIIIYKLKSKEEKMDLSIELTAYPLEEKYLPIIEDYIEHLKSYKNVIIKTFPTCSVIYGQHDDVIKVLSSSIKWSVENHNKVIFITKFLPNYKAI